MKIMIEINDKVVDVMKSVFTKRNAIIGIVVLFFIGGVFVFSQAVTKPHDFSTGEIISAEDMNDNFDVLYEKVNELDARNPVFGYVPIGSIVAWHKSMTGTPDLPEGWVECNGQSISDNESLYFNLEVPNLNDEGRFLRGSDVSGTRQEATSILDYSDMDGVINIQNWDTTDGEKQINRITSVDFVSDTFSYYKVRPVNMSVVWIMRIK